MALLLSAAVVAGTSGCTVTGRAHAPQGQVASYAAQQQAVRQESHAASSCAVVLTGMRATVDAYNAMVATLNATQDMAALKGTDQTALVQFDLDAQRLRTAQGRDLPADVKTALSNTARASSELRKAVAGQERLALNPAARDWDQSRRQLVTVCRNYLPR